MNRTLVTHRFENVRSDLLELSSNQLGAEGVARIEAVLPNARLFDQRERFDDTRYAAVGE